MQTLTARFEIVTPMFIGGAHPDDPPEIRPPSVKGALRFWWRALQWGDCLANSGNDNDQALQRLHQQEAELFGLATQKGEPYGQGLVAIKVSSVIKGVETTWPTNNDPGSGFLGYGLDKTQSGDPHRKGIKAGEFTLTLILKPKTSPEQIHQLKQTLLLFGLLGGLGSRSRRGFGSVAISQLNEQSYHFAKTADYLAQINHLLSHTVLAPTMPAFSALNQAMRIAHAGEHSDYRRLMDQLGAQYKQARQNAGKGLNKLPFGLPLAGNRGDCDENNRRAGPLYMHIHQIGKTYLALVSFIPSVFHPAYPSGQNLEFYQPVENFIQSLEAVYP